MPNNDPEIGTTAQAQLTVGPDDLASALPLTSTDNFPKVFATARMIALMEIASARLLQPSLSAGELSVGVSVHVTHGAPTPVGATVIATSRYLGREGKLLLFEVIAEDEGGEIGRGKHKRAIVDSERLRAGANKRMPGAES